MGHGHSHAPANYHRAFALGVDLNAIYIVAELVTGFAIDSVALIADAGHNISDVFALLRQAAKELHDKFEIVHTTIQLERTLGCEGCEPA